VVTNTLESLIELLRSDGVEVLVNYFPSGAISIELRSNGHFVVVDGVPSGAQWGVSCDVKDREGFAGHERVLDSLELAFAVARNLLRSNIGDKD